MDTEGLVQIGTVTALKGRQARVKLGESSSPTGWLTVLQSPATVAVESTGGGYGEAAFSSHSHQAQVKPWMPKVNDRVLVLYLPVYGGDGFILGGL